MAMSEEKRKEIENKAKIAGQQARIKAEARMASKRVWTVRVVQMGDPSDRSTMAGRDRIGGLWIEQMRYLGYLNVLKEWDGTDAGTEVLEFLPFAGVDSKSWADMNAERMRSFGINAASAPKWENAYGATL